MSTASIPSIACIGVIGKHVVSPPPPNHSLSANRQFRPQDNPLHIALFPPHTKQPGAYLEFSFLLNASLDIFDLRARDKNKVDQDLGLLHAVDERLSVWGWETGTGVKFAIVLDMWGKEGHQGGLVLGIKEGELKPVSFFPGHGIAAEFDFW